MATGCELNSPGHIILLSLLPCKALTSPILFSCHLTLIEQDGGIEQLPCEHIFYQSTHLSGVPISSPSRGGNVAVYAFDSNQPSLPTLF